MIQKPFFSAIFQISVNRLYLTEHFPSMNSHCVNNTSKFIKFVRSYLIENFKYKMAGFLSALCDLERVSFFNINH